MGQPTSTPHPTPDLVVNVWPDGKMPGTATTKPEGEETPNADGVLHVTNVSTPTLAVFKAPGATDKTPAMLVCPGGGYYILAYHLEGTEIAAWLNSVGITAIVLKYRVPQNREGAFQDIQRAMRVVRQHAAEWKIDPDRLGILGFSAGGHLCARLSNNYKTMTYPEIDEADKLSCEPKCAVLVYPAFLVAKGETKLVPEMPVSAATPPTLMIHAEDDPYYLNSPTYHAALDAVKVPNQFISYPTGGHGFGLHAKTDAKTWPDKTAEWLHKNGI